MNDIISNMDKAVDCVELPYVIFCFIALIIVLKNKWFPYFIVSALLWRQLYAFSSSRYYTSLLILCSIIFILSFKKIQHNRYFHHIVLGITIAFLGYNSIDNNSSFRNNYILDAKEAIKTFNNKDNKGVTWIDKNEYNRLSYKSDKKRIKNIFSTVNDSIKQTLNWGGDIYIMTKNVVDYNDSQFNNKLLNSKLISRFKTNKKNKSLFFYRTTIVDRSKEFNFYSDNFIKNGDFEILASSQEKKAMLNVWSKAKDCFYCSDEFIWPKTDFLLPTWGYFNKDEVPLVNIISEKPIDGNHSLHIFSNETSFIYFCNKFVISEGLLKITIKNLGNDCELIIAKFDYDQINSSPIFTEKDDNMIFLKENEEKEICIYIDKQTIHGKYSLFYLTGNHFDILIDNIGFFESKRYNKVL